MSLEIESDIYVLLIFRLQGNQRLSIRIPMFTILQLKNSQSLNQACQQYIRETLNKFSLTTDGLWLRTLKLDEVQFKWCPAMQ